MKKEELKTLTLPDEQKMYEFGAAGHALNAIAGYYGLKAQELYDYINQRPRLWIAFKRGAFEANTLVQSKAFEMATSGEHPTMTIFWLKTKCGFREDPIFSFIVNKFDVRDPDKLTEEQAEETYRIAVEALKDREQQYEQKKTENETLRRMKKKSPAKNLEEHLKQIEQGEKK